MILYIEQYFFIEEDKMSKKNKKTIILMVIELTIIIMLAVPMVNALMNKKSESTVPTIQTDAQTTTINWNEILNQDITTTSTEVQVQSTTENIITPEVTKNSYSFYKDKDKTTSIKGIDVSEFQGYIDWERVKESGIEFAFIRIGCRTYDDGGIIFDKRFKENLYSADRAGVKTGVYFFSQALTVDEAVAEADAVIEAIEGFNITYPVVFDWEIIAEDYARTDGLSIESLSNCCVAFCERIKEAGYTPMIYQNKSTLLYNVDLPKIKEYDIWLAEYNDEPTYSYDFKIWQYASDGHVSGISTEVDMNISFKDYSKQ